jgi:hypothetical protein
VELGTNALKTFIDNINKNEKKTDQSSRTLFSLAIYLKKKVCQVILKINRKN